MWFCWLVGLGRVVLKVEGRSISGTYTIPMGWGVENMEERYRRIAWCSRGIGWHVETSWMNESRILPLTSFLGHPLQCISTSPSVTCM